MSVYKRLRIFMLGFVSDCLLNCFIYIGASFSECVFALLYLEGGVGGNYTPPCH